MHRVRDQRLGGDLTLVRARVGLLRELDHQRPVVPGGVSGHLEPGVVRVRVCASRENVKITTPDPRHLTAGKVSELRSGQARSSHFSVLLRVAFRDSAPCSPNPKHILSTCYGVQYVKKKKKRYFLRCTLVFPLFYPCDAHRYHSLQNRSTSRSAASALKFSCLVHMLTMARMEDYILR